MFSTHHHHSESCVNILYVMFVVYQHVVRDHCRGVKSNSKQPSIKNVWRIVKRDMKSKVAAKKWLWCYITCRLMRKTFGNETVLLIFFAINIPSKPFLGCHLEFHIFFHHDLGAAVFSFLSWVVYTMDMMVTVQLMHLCIPFLCVSNFKTIG